ncbi:MAG: hypothetical protein E3J94_07265 [Desulfobacteraceae bacterium]|nr:MAG: hypothetical protein E3J94_07265 [Desulfobacteraceae bacterium]
MMKKNKTILKCFPSKMITIQGKKFVITPFNVRRIDKPAKDDELNIEMGCDCGDDNNKNNGKPKPWADLLDVFEFDTEKKDLT